LEGEGEGGRGGGGREEEVVVSARHGVYSETPDALPLLGSVRKEVREGGRARLVYCVGCNAWGEASLTYAASLVPGLLGYRELSVDEEEAARLMSIRRFSGA